MKGNSQITTIKEQSFISSWLESKGEETPILPPSIWAGLFRDWSSFAFPFTNFSSLSHVRLTRRHEMAKVSKEEQSMDRKRGRGGIKKDHSPDYSIKWSRIVGGGLGKERQDESNEGRGGGREGRREWREANSNCLSLRRWMKLTWDEGDGMETITHHFLGM